ncbi:MAG: hypothetical protein QOI91_2122 [Solirubrobacteraceae bacterium]|nr:hypothetical protein [Solirubrobacteraceae bacterium]
MTGLPFPPEELRERVGWVPGAHGTEAYDNIGLATKRAVVAALPDDWSWDGKRVLDFGCGSGRMLRHLLAEGERAEIWGCDIHGPSVDWVTRHLPFHAFRNTREPGLDLAPDGFDLVIATSVFTHIGREWARWLLELRRILREGGLLFATFLGPGTVAATARADWDPEILGMTVLHDVDVGEALPDVLHSEWWLREHWGRAFEVVDLRARGFGFGEDPGEDAGGHGWVLLRRAGEAPSAEELAAPNPVDPRELPAALHARDVAWGEAERLLARLQSAEAVRRRASELEHDREVARDAQRLARHDHDVAGHDRDVARHDRDVARHERDIARHERDDSRARLAEVEARLAAVESELATVYAGRWWSLRARARPLLRLASATRRT